MTANDYARRVEELYTVDTVMTAYYNKVLAGGKWEKMMSDIHLGYTKWSMPKRDSVPQVVRVEPLSKPTMGVAVEGCETLSPEGELELPVLIISRIASITSTSSIGERGHSILRSRQTNLGWT